MTSTPEARPTATTTDAQHATETPAVPPLTESPLALSLLQIASNSDHVLSAGDSDIFLIAVDGTAQAEVGNESHGMTAGTAILVPAGTTASITTDEGLSALKAEAGPRCDRHAPLGEGDVVVQVDADHNLDATGKRSFQILFDAGNGSTRATLFVGYVPPGRAPWHFHQYDEIVWIWNGAGRLHLADGTTELTRGSAFRLPPRTVHIVENTTNDDLTLIGLFTPAGSPAAAYLADSP